MRVSSAHSVTYSDSLHYDPTEMKWRLHASKSFRLMFRSFICPTSYQYGKGREHISVSLVRQQPPQLFTVTAGYNDRQATRVGRDDAVYRSLVHI